MAKQVEWSEPYFRVQHLEGLRRGWQITVTERAPDFAECWVRPEGAGFNGHTTSHGSIEEARAHGEQQAYLMDAFTRSAA